MFYVTDQMYRMVERIQKNAFLSLNIDPVEVIRRNARLIKQDDNENLETLYSKMVPAGLYSMMPEHHYDTSFEFFKFYRDCAVTPYDRSPFLERFVNIMSLCHELYTNGNQELRRNIIVTSLPFLNLNGVCIRHDVKTDVVFLNEGLLSALPKIYRFLLPFCDSQLFGIGIPHKNLSNALTILTNACFLKNAYNDLKDNPEFEYPHGNEKWYFMRKLQQEVEQNMRESKGNEDSRDTDEFVTSEHPSTSPFTQKMAHFLACRGAFVFLLGHEFSHAYCDHCDYRDRDDINFRSTEMLEALEKQFEKELGCYPGLSIYNQHFCVHQPIEEEADAHGLLCVSKYCVDNELDDQKAMCVLIGAVVTFIVIEMHESLSNLYMLGTQSAREFMNVNPLVRNMLFREEHPVPITRLTMALNHEVLRDDPAGEVLGRLNQWLIQIHQVIFHSIEGHFGEVETALHDAEMLDTDIAALFHGHSCLGAHDLSRIYFSKICTMFDTR